MGAPTLCREPLLGTRDLAVNNTDQAPDLRRKTGSKLLSVTFQHSSSARPPLQPHLAVLPCQPAGLTISSSGSPRAIFLQSLSLA